MSFWADQRVVVTGGGGFLGHRVVDRVRASGAPIVLAPPSVEYDLRRADDIRRMYDDTRPSLVIHLATGRRGPVV